jgi:hypothetical protein
MIRTETENYREMMSDAKAGKMMLSGPSIKFLINVMS